MPWDWATTPESDLPGDRDLRRAALTRRVGVVLLAGYVGIVVLAAWRHEIRPALLDGPTRWARAVLALVGVPPGVAVFTTDIGTAPDAKLSASCLEVRIVEAGGATRRLYPPGTGACPEPPPRLWVRGEAIALYRTTAGLRAAVGAARSGQLGPSRQALPRLLAESVAEHFRFRAHRQGLAPERYALLWTEQKVSYRSGERSEVAVALVEWSDAPGSVFVRWRPDAGILRARWPALGAE